MQTDIPNTPAKPRGKPNVEIMQIENQPGKRPSNRANKAPQKIQATKDGATTCFRSPEEPPRPKPAPKPTPTPKPAPTPSKTNKGTSIEFVSQIWNISKSH